MTASHSKKLNRLQDEPIERIKQYIKNKGKFLEIGCGDGNFLSKAREVFKYAFGIEPSKKFYDLCQKKKLNVKNIYLNNNTDLSENLM
ncbi:MAG: class I SAM-dependent methyltransferase [Acidaminococcaceae bacterium]|nr:class I SAM-dependent methyltransferase [Acidaminococcaceae bacterium]